jgi:protein-tyrosine phosphatase
LAGETPMIDLHSHLLPGIDDGAADQAAALEMARMAVADGTRIMACTPHVFPPKHNNDTAFIADRVAALRQILQHNDIDLMLVVGGDVHLLPDLPARLRAGTAPTLNNSRYFLLEPNHTIVPPNFVAIIRSYLEAGFIPIITHPERLTWMAKHYALFCEAEEAGAAVQVTAGALTGHFGGKVRALAERMVSEGRVDVIASDAHDPVRRPPGLAAARAAAARLLGDKEADLLVIGNPGRVLSDEPLPGKQRRVSVETPGQQRKGLLGWLGGSS